MRTTVAAPSGSEPSDDSAPDKPSDPTAADGPAADAAAE